MDALAAARLGRNQWAKHSATVRQDIEMLGYTKIQIMGNLGGTKKR